MSKETKPLANPFEGVTQENGGARATAVLPAEDLMYLKSLDPKRGLVQTVLNMILHDIIEQLKHENINYYSPENADRLAEIVRSRCTFTCSN